MQKIKTTEGCTRARINEIQEFLDSPEGRRAVCRAARSCPGFSEECEPEVEDDRYNDLQFLGDEPMQVCCQYCGQPMKPVPAENQLVVCDSCGQKNVARRCMNCFAPYYTKKTSHRPGTKRDQKVLREKKIRCPHCSKPIK